MLSNCIRFSLETFNWVDFQPIPRSMYLKWFHCCSEKLLYLSSPSPTKTFSVPSFHLDDISAILQLNPSNILTYRKVSSTSRHSLKNTNHNYQSGGPTLTKWFKWTSQIKSPLGHIITSGVLLPNMLNLRRLRQEDWEFKANLDHTEGPISKSWNTINLHWIRRNISQTPNQ